MKQLFLKIKFAKAAIKKQFVSRTLYGTSEKLQYNNKILKQMQYHLTPTTIYQQQIIEIHNKDYYFEMVLSIQDGCKVLCSFGDFLPIRTNPDGTAKRQRGYERIECTVLQALTDRNWMVRLPDGLLRICATSQM